MKDFSFNKSERLSGKIPITELFKKSNALNAHGLRMLWINQEYDKPTVKVLISVPKRIFPKAVHRILIKRRLREAYRLLKPEFYSLASQYNTSFHLALIIMSKDIPDFISLSQKIELLLTKLTKQCEKNA